MLSRTYVFDRIFIGSFSYNGDLLEELGTFCLENSIKTGWISIIGAIKDIKLGYYNQEKKEYMTLSSDQLGAEKSFEIASCSGNISIKDDKPFVHLHLVATDKNGKAFGGHLMPGTIIFAGEFIIQTFKGEDLVRVSDEKTGLFLWKD